MMLGLGVQEALGQEVGRGLVGQDLVGRGREARGLLGLEVQDQGLLEVRGQGRRGLGPDRAPDRGQGQSLSRGVKSLVMKRLRTKILKIRLHH